MNTQRLLDIIAYIEKYPEKYNQDRYTSECGTKHCIAGFAQLAYDRIYPVERYADTSDTASHTHAKAITYLEITTGQGDYLFYPSRTLDEIREFARSGGIYQLDRVDCRHYS